MNRICTLSAMVIAVSTVACTNLEPNIETKPLDGYDLVDRSKIDVDKYDKDYAECALIANQDTGSVGKTATKAVGTVADRASFGLIGNKASKDADRTSVLKRCLTGRGYNILR
jgi:hypothetical protein